MLDCVQYGIFIIMQKKNRQIRRAVDLIAMPMQSVIGTVLTLSELPVNSGSGPRAAITLDYLGLYSIITID